MPRPHFVFLRHPTSQPNICGTHMHIWGPVLIVGPATYIENSMSVSVYFVSVHWQCLSSFTQPASGRIVSNWLPNNNKKGKYKLATLPPPQQQRQQQQQQHGASACPCLCPCPHFPKWLKH
ncbi:GH24040 [Drosophila grimshawi]|uniref:GH24040 n=1 Tax=Drosophila grimshawi TaxID=7222 RepID=B4JME2_DROGR|nr:GH24040 [Drosophila grimshawi]